MVRLVSPRLHWLFAVAIATVLASSQSVANGDIGEHVNNMKPHLEEYTGEIRWFLGEVDGMVAAYQEGGAQAAEPAKLVDHWEAVMFHGAIETTYVPIYASIWQGIIGLQQAMQQGKTQGEVEVQQDALEQAMWQALGAVKLAAEQQQADASQGATASPETLGIEATLEEIRENLANVVAKYASQEAQEAVALVHATYANRFEGIEGDLIEQDANLVEDLEKDFNVTLPQALDGDTPVSRVKDIVDAMQDKLDRASKLLAEAEANRKDVF